MEEKLINMVPMSFDNCSYEEFSKRVKDVLATSALFGVKYGSRIIVVTIVMGLGIIAGKALDDLKKL